MKGPLTAFVDSDVVVSSLFSQSGAAYLLINNANLKLFISDISFKELEIVVERLGLDRERLEEVVKKRFKIIKLKKTLAEVKKIYAPYVMDVNDTHIVAGAVQSQVKFLISYNLKHFKTDKIKTDFDILPTKPATFLQYLRSL